MNYMFKLITVLSLSLFFSQHAGFLNKINPFKKRRSSCQISENAPFLSKKFNPLQTVILFDFHDVLGLKNKFSMGFKAFSLGFSHLKNHGFKKFKKTLSRASDIKKDIKTYEGLFIQLTQEFPELKDYLQNYLSIANSHYLDNSMRPLLQNLKDQGYMLVLASNIGPLSYQYLCDHNPEIKNFFETFFDETYISVFDQKRNRWIEKPNIEFYIRILDDMKKKYPQRTDFLLVDDKKENIDGAYKVGIHGHLFTQSRIFEKYLRNHKFLVA